MFRTYTRQYYYLLMQWVYMGDGYHYQMNNITHIH